MYAHMILRRLGYKFLLNVMYYYNYMRYLCTPALAKTRLNWSSFKICSVFSEAGFKEPGNVPGCVCTTIWPLWPLFRFPICSTKTRWVLLERISEGSVTALCNLIARLWYRNHILLLDDWVRFSSVLCWGCICFWRSDHGYRRRLCPVLDFLLQRILAIINGLRSPWYTTNCTMLCFSFYVWIFLFWRVP